MKTWTDERGADKKLTIVSDEAFYVDDSDKTDFPAAVAAIAAGASPGTVLNPKSDQILLTTIFRLESEETDTCLTIHYRKGSDKDFETYYYSTAAVRDAVLAELKARLGPGFDSHRDVYGVGRAIYGSLMTITITVLLSWLLVGAARAIREAEELEISGRKAWIKRLFAGVLDLLGPTGVMIVCWIVVLAALMNLYRRASNPPVMTIIQSEPYKGASLTGTAVKYLLLFLLVFVTARAIVP